MPLVTEEKCQECAAIARDMTNPYFQVSKCIVCHSGRQTEWAKARHTSSVSIAYVEFSYWLHSSSCLATISCASFMSYHSCCICSLWVVFCHMSVLMILKKISVTFLLIHADFVSWEWQISLVVHHPPQLLQWDLDLQWWSHCSVVQTVLVGTNSWCPLLPSVVCKKPCSTIRLCHQFWCRALVLFH